MSFVDLDLKPEYRSLLDDVIRDFYKPKEISDALIEAFACGTTKIAATGGYSNAEKTIIYFVVNRFQISRMKNLVHAIDPKAFVTISDVADVFKAND